MQESRVFLVVVDDTPELRAALTYACHRAHNSGGRVALLRVVEPEDLQYSSAIDDLIRSEARDTAEALLHRLAGDIQPLTGQMPVLYLREGNPRDELIKLIHEEPQISVLVLAADPGPHGPGPLVTAMTGRLISRLRVPVTIVPGNLSDAQIQAIS